MFLPCPGALVEMEDFGLVFRDMAVAYGEVADVGDTVPDEYAPGERCSNVVRFALDDGAKDAEDRYELERESAGIDPLVLSLGVGDPRGPVSRRRA